MASTLWIQALPGLLIAGASLFGYAKWRRSARLRFIRGYVFPTTVRRKVQALYPHLSEHQTDQVLQALRDYFEMCALAGRRMVSMPSQVVDVAWHEFILFTKAYEQFCRRSFGRFLHHTPTEAMRSPTHAQDGIKRAWRLACGIKQIHPRMPTALPLIFGIDAALAIPDGFRYSLDCRDKTSPTYGDGYCASHIGCGGGCGGGFDGGSSGSDAGTDAHGDGGDGGGGDGGGCGGGCGGD